MSNNHWLYSQLMREGLTNLSKDYSPLIELNIHDKVYKIYAPGSEDYLITRELVERVKDMGGNTIVYSSWCSPSSESKVFSDGNKVEVLSNAEFFRRIRQRKFKA